MAYLVLYQWKNTITLLSILCILPECILATVWCQRMTLNFLQLSSDSFSIFMETSNDKLCEMFFYVLL